MTDVETLRAAAEKLRQLAKQATPGPWEIEYTYGGGAPQAIFRMDPEHPDDPDLSTSLGVMEENPQDNAWVATVHPGVAEPWAELLETVASHEPERAAPDKEPYGCVRCGVSDGVGACDTWRDGLAVARVIVGAGPKEPADSLAGQGQAPSSLGDEQCLFPACRDPEHCSMGGRCEDAEPAPADRSEALHEWRCPSCGATTRAQMADRSEAPSLEQQTARMLAEFHTAFGQHFGDGGSGSNELRKTLHQEEHDELIEALTSGDRVAIAQELADVVYVAYGTAYSLGIHLDAVIAEVHRANMSKADENGRFHLRADGKVIKPSGFRPADIASALRVCDDEGGQE